MELQIQKEFLLYFHDNNIFKKKTTKPKANGSAEVRGKRSTKK